MGYRLGPCQSRIALLALLMAALLGMAACSTTTPEGMTAVTPFDINRYQGRWYEIARMDHFFERGLTDVTANYRLQSDGSIEVINRGHDNQRKTWKQVVGRGLFVGDTNRGALKVSFFGPFYAGYHVVALDQQNYQWAMIAGPNRDYFWILARERRLSVDTREQLLELAKALRIDTSNLIWVEQTRDDH